MKAHRVPRLLPYCGSLKNLAIAAGVLLLSGGGVMVGGEAPLRLDIALANSNAVLTWSNPSALLQTSTNLSGGWSSLPTATSPYVVARTAKAAFFRLSLSSAPTILSTEPGYLTTGGGTFYLTGTGFAAGSVVYLNGNPASTTYINSNLLSVSTGALGARSYDVSVANVGQTTALLANGLTVESTPQASLETPPGISSSVTAAGEFRQSCVDLAIPSGVGPSFVLARTYRTRLGPAVSAVGSGWDFSGNIGVQTSGADVVVHDGGGRADTFFHQSDGSFTHPGFFRQGTLSGQIFTLTFADKSRWLFNALNAATAPGKIAQAIDRNGNAMTYAYDTSGRLATVTDAAGRAVSFAYNGSSQLTGVTDSAGRTVTYGYDGSHNLTSVTTPAVTGTPNGNDFPSGKTTTYTYDANHRLTSVIDPTGTVVVTNQYSASTNPAAVDYAHLVSSALGTNPPTVFSYEAQTPSPANRFATVKMVVNDPVGNVTSVLYDSRNRPLEVDQFTGRATPGVAVTASANQPTGKLRASDPALYQTTYAYNIDSQVTQVTEPRGNSAVMVYQGDSGSATPVRERGNLLTLTETPAPGVPADQAQRVESWTYQPGFGTGEDATEKFNVKQEFGPTAPIRRKDVELSYPTSHTDPLGHVWNYSYDANGNQLTAQPPGVTTGDSFTYNTAGQVTAHTHPADANGRRQQDTFSYYASGVQKGYLQSAVADSSGLALTTSYAYDAFGNVTNVVDPRGNNSLFVYNQLDQLVRASSPTGPGGKRSQTDVTYDAAEAVLTSIGIVDFYHSIPVPHLDLTVRVSMALPGRVTGTTVQNFDQNGNAEADATLATGYGYDPIGRLTSVTNQVSGAATTVTRFGHDATGQVTSVMSPLAASGADASNTMAASYDERGLPFQQTAAPGSPGQSTTQYTYDANANLAALTEGLESNPRTTTVVADGFEVVSVYHTDPMPIIDFRVRVIVATFVQTTWVAGVAAQFGIPQFGIPRAPAGHSTGSGSGSISTAKGDPPKTLTNQGRLFDSGPSFGDFPPIDPGTIPTPDLSIPGLQWQFDLIPGIIPGPLYPTTGGSAAPTTSKLPIVDFYHSNPLPHLDFYLHGIIPGSLTPTTGGSDFMTAVKAKNSSICRIKDNSKDVFPGIITDPLGNVTTHHYDANDNLVSTSVTGTNGQPGGSNVSLASATAQYDALGRCTSATAAILNSSGTSTGSATTSAAFADNGQTTALTDALGHTTTYAYDTVSRVSAVTDPKGNSVTYAYDPNSNVTAVTRHLKSDLGNADLVFSQVFAYDNLNRVTSASDNVGNTSTCAYDSRGNVVQTTDARGIVSQYQYDGLNRLTATGRDLNNNGAAFDAADLVTTQTYDDNSRLIAATDPNGNTTSYAYDSLNRRTQTTQADGTVASCVYDIHGNVTAATDANGTVVAASYDAGNRLTGKSITPAAGVATTTTAETYAYNGLDRLTQASNNSSSSGFTYDSLGDTLSETQDGLTTTSSYDALGRRLSIAYPGGRTLAYTYDAANLCSSVTLAADASGDTLGLLATHHFIGGLPERRDNRNHTQTLYTYDGAVGVANASGDSGWARLSHLQTVNTLTSAVIDETTLAYDAAQNQSAKTSGFPGTVRARTYQFDAANRLVNTVVTTNAVETRNTVYTLDKAGNRLGVTGDAHPGTYTLSGADLEDNQYTSTPVADFSYDANGNRRAESSAGQVVRSFAYDCANQLTGITTLSGGGSQSLTVANAGFETTVIPNNGAFIYGVPVGWQLYDPAAMINETTNAVGVIRPNPGGQFFPAGTTQGINAGLVYLSGAQQGVAGLQQTLAATLQANTTYTLQVDVGNTAPGTSLAGSTGGAGIFYNFTGFPGYQIQLLAGGVSVAMDNNTLNGSIPEGQFRTATVSFNPGASNPMLGQPLSIRLINLKLGGLEVAFDNVRLAATTTPVATPLASYTYDALGRRIQKSVISGAVTTITKFVYAGGTVIEERNGAGTVVVSHNASFGIPVASVLVRSYNNYSAPSYRANGTNYYPHTDAAGSTMALTLDSGGVAERYDYADCGEVQFYDGGGVAIGASAVGNTRLFGGLQLDSENGLYEAAASSLDPRVGACLQRDVGDAAAMMAPVKSNKGSGAYIIRNSK